MHVTTDTAFLESSQQYNAYSKSCIFPTDYIYVMPWNLVLGYQYLREIFRLHLHAVLYNDKYQKLSKV
jgi:hypothetical protein